MDIFVHTYMLTYIYVYISKGTIRSAQNQNPLVHKILDSIKKRKNVRPVSASKIIKKNSIFNPKVSFYVY